MVYNVIKSTESKQRNISVNLSSSWYKPFRTRVKLLCEELASRLDIFPHHLDLALDERLLSRIAKT